ncbi:bifunctional metallophosphatase/5'-nucleotidase [Patiriisocius marinus]|nr:bifunctional metallophosphatase/5'-nucleotidase [Patiriisocius marinus]
MKNSKSYISYYKCLNRNFLLIFSVIFLLFASCKTSKISEVKSNETVTIKLVQMNDVYEIAPLSGGQYGGLARVAYVTDSIRNANPNTYLVMAGDFLNPSLIGTLKVDGKRVKGKQMIDVMNVMGVDLATFGNHEFDLKENELQERLNESEFQWTSANVFQKNGDDIRTFNTVKNLDSTPIPETVFYDINIGKEYPVRLGFFSVTIDSNPMDYVYYSDFMLEGKSAYTALEQSKSDIIIGLTHLSIKQDMQLAESLPNIDLVLGGHEHTAMLVPTSHAKVAKADANARTIYVHTLTYNHKADFLKIDSELVPITANTPELPKVKVVVDKWGSILEAELKNVIDNPNEIVYFAKKPLNGLDKPNRSEQTNLGKIITEGMAKSFNLPVDAAIVNGGSIRLDDVLENEISAIDVFRVLPFGGNVQRVEITGELLMQVLDYGEKSVGTGAYLHRYKLQNKNGVWYLGAKPLINDKIYTLALSDYLLKGLDIPILSADSPGVKSIYVPVREEAAHDIRKAVIDFMKTLK